jgi:hypothetical protein
MNMKTLASVSATRCPAAPRRFPVFSRARLLFLVGVWSLLGAAQAQSPSAVGSVPSEQAQAALQHLLQPGAVSSTGGARPDTAVSTSADPAAIRRQTLVRPGETLDRVIARTLRDSPFRIEVLREAFVRLNRAAFPRGSPHWVSAGATLQVPTVVDVLDLVDPQRLLFGVPTPAPTAGPARSSAPTADADRRNWVRYP